MEGILTNEEEHADDMLDLLKAHGDQQEEARSGSSKNNGKHNKN